MEAGRYSPRMPLLASIAALRLLQGEARVQADFDRALRTGDGALFRRISREREVRGVSAGACGRFLARFAAPWARGASPVMGRDGRRLGWSDPRNGATIRFRATGGADIVVNERRTLLFETPVVREGGGFKATTGFAQILFARADGMPVPSGRGRAAKMQEAQRIVEGWIAETRRMGIPGSIEPEKNRFQTWDEVIRASRAEIGAMPRG